MNFFVVRSTNNKLSVWSNGNMIHNTIATNYSNNRTTFQIPNANGTIFRTADNTLAIWCDCNRSYRTRVTFKCFYASPRFNIPNLNGVSFFPTYYTLAIWSYGKSIYAITCFCQKCFYCNNSCIESISTGRKFYAIINSEWIQRNVAQIEIAEIKS